MPLFDDLRLAIEARATDLARTIPANRAAAQVALIAAIDALPETAPDPSHTDPLTGLPTPSLGANRALHLALTAPGEHTDDASNLGHWADTFLDHCHQLAAAELALAHLETGFLRPLHASETTIDLRIARKTPPARWRERADAAWWAEHQHHLPSATVTDHVAHLAGLVDLPRQTHIDGVDLDFARRVIAHLMDNPIAETSSQELADHLAMRLDAPTPDIAAVLDALTLTPENAVWHAAVPGIADPPLVALANGNLAVSRRGLHTDPFRFLTRDLRRRAPNAYHNAAIARETAFRTDLYALFSHSRFVTSPSRIELRREKGTLRTDIDAAVFDRKTGTLAIFELKSHEPFARSTAELERTQSNVRAAGRQVSGILDWINRHGADEILNRIDRRTAKGFRVQRVQPFVLGRHLIDAGESTPLDTRCTWATWPQILRLLSGQPVETLGTNPITSLATRLTQAEPWPSPRTVPETITINLGPVALRIHALT